MTGAIFDVIVKSLLIISTLAMLGCMLSVPISVFMKNMKLGAIIAKICNVAIYIVAVAMFICLAVAILTD